MTVELQSGLSAGEILYQLLAHAATQFPEALQVPASAKSFRQSYQEVLPKFEAARVASDRADDIARLLAEEMREFIVWRDGAREIPLYQQLEQRASPLPLQTQSFAGQPGWKPRIMFGGKCWEASMLGALGSHLAAQGLVTQNAAYALQRVQDQILQRDQLVLSGCKVAVLGGGAEMAPTRLWLEAGADVLWLDTQPPPSEWFESEELSGRLFWSSVPADLLEKPAEMLATLRAFADGEPMDLGLYAYAPGQAREMRLTAAMNAMVDALEPELIRSVTMLVSPTTPTLLSSDDFAQMNHRQRARPGWEKLLARLGLLGRGGGCVMSGPAKVTRSVVTIQGTSYQAAQYIGKLMTAISWAKSGQLNDGPDRPLRVSANTAAITRTRSLDHPVFAAAFGGATALGVQTLTPRQSRRLNGLLAVADWFGPDLPSPGQVRVHGGIHALPYPLTSALYVAAAIGFCRAPRLLAGLLRN